MTEPMTISSAEMRALEQAAIDSGKVTGLELMERAGQGVVDAIFEEWPELGTVTKYATVLCGPGNNGGDGFVIARRLAERGWAVEMPYLGDPMRYSPDAAKMFSLVPNTVLAVQITADEAPAIGSAIFETETVLVIDAVFGIGLSRALDRDYAGLLCSDLAMYHMADLGVKCVAVDIPSGLSSDHGQPLGNAFRAHLTVTFHSLKPGHVLRFGPEYCGKTVVKDIGL